MPDEETTDKLKVGGRGDWTGKIAKDFNIPTADTVYDNDPNSHLREIRPEKNLLTGGDEVWVPVSPVPEFPTKGKNNGQVGIGVTLADRERVIIILKNTEGEILSNLDYTLSAAELDEEISGTTDSDGKIEQEIPPGVQTLTLRIAEKTITLNMGYLDPIEMVTGYGNRMKNLACFTGRIPEKKNMALYRAIRRFQQANSLTRTGNMDAPTRDKLTELYGC